MQASQGAIRIGDRSCGTDRPANARIGSGVWNAYSRPVRHGALEILLNARRRETRAAKVAAIRAATELGERPFQRREP